MIFKAEVIICIMLAWMMTWSFGYVVGRYVEHEKHLNLHDPWAGVEYGQ